MKLILFLFIVLSTGLTTTATKTTLGDTTYHSIRFIQGVAWSKVIEMARHEQKSIFVDCFATWCGPCKRMDKEIFTKEHVGSIYNKCFVCVKMQMDKSNHDDESVRNTYDDAEFFMNNYGIKAFPTFLYFDQDGNILKKGIGAMDADEFIGLAADALNPNKNYSLLLKQFKAGKRDMVEMRNLAEDATSLGDTAEARLIADAYFNNLNENELLVKDNIQFIGRFTKSSKEVGFELFFRHADTVNKIMGDDTYAQSVVHQVIYNEIAIPELKATSLLVGEQPDWAGLSNRIANKFGEYYAERVVIAAHANWSAQYKYWEEWSKYFTLFQDKFGSKTNAGHWPAFSLNNNAWAVFTYSTSAQALTEALSWSAKAVLMDPYPNWIDTYANLLYKLGQKPLALKWENIACKMDTANNTFRKTLEQMNKDQPTWPTH